MFALLVCYCLIHCRRPVLATIFGIYLYIIVMITKAPTLNAHLVLLDLDGEANASAALRVVHAAQVWRHLRALFVVVQIACFLLLLLSLLGNSQLSLVCLCVRVCVC